MAGNASGIRAGGAFIELFVKGNVGKSFDDLQKKLKNFGASVTDVGKKLAGIGAAIVAPLVLAAQRFAAMGEEMEIASKKTGVGVAALSELKYAAEQSGSSLEELEGAMRKMNKTVFEAETGSKEAQQALAALGLTVEDLKGKSKDEQLKLISTRLSGLADSGTEASIAMEIFGKSANLAFLGLGADKIEALQKRARELGLTMSDEDAAAAAKWAQTLRDLWDQLNAITFQIGKAVSTALQPFATAATKVLKTIIDWVKAHQPLIIAVLTTGAALVALGTAIIGLGLSITLVSTAMAGIASAFAFVGSVLGLLLNPIVLVGAGLVALAGYFAYTSGKGAQALTWLGNKFNALKDIATEAFGGITDALTAGDILLAAQILWTGLKLAFLTGPQEIQATWAKFRATFVQVAAAAFYGALEIYQNVKAALLTAFENTTAYLSGIWDGFVGNFLDVWYGAINKLANAFETITGYIAKKITSVRTDLTDAEKEATNKAIDKDTQDHNSGRDSAETQRQQDRANKELNDATTREAQRKASVDAIQKAKQDAIKDLDAKESALNEAADKNAADEIAKLEKQKIELKKQLDELRGKARIEKEDQTDKDDSDEDDKPDGDALRQVKVKAIGTFNAAAWQSLAGGAVQGEMLDAAKQTAKNTKKIADNPPKFK